MTKRDPNLSRSALRKKRDIRIRAIFDESFEADLHYIYYRSIYEKLKPVDHKAVNNAIKKILPAQVIRDAKKNINNPSDRDTARWLSDVSDSLQNLEDRMSRSAKRKKPL